MNSSLSRRPAGDHLLTFVVVADTHTNQAEDESTSPYASHRLANARCRHVIAEIDSLDPAFVVHLGDIVHPVPELPTYAEAADAFKQTAKRLRAPLHVVPGNHDIGDKVISWSPAGSIDEDKIAIYEKHFGAHYYSVDHGDLHLVVINAPLINSGLACESEQRAWLEADLESNRNRRTFMFIYLLPSTAFVRHDYSEFFRTTPVNEAGRNDGAKLGYVVVRVYAQGHVAQNVRSYGRTLAPDVAYVPSTPPLPVPHTRTSPVVNLGVDLRHPWAEEVEIPPSGALEEFARKKVRNDYALQALWETGLRRLRIPLDDFLDARIRRRMAALVDLGHLFQAYHYGLPRDEAYDVLLKHSHLLDALELVGDARLLDGLLTESKTLVAAGGPRVLLSRTDRKGDHAMTGGRFSHLVGHGFSVDDGDMLEALLTDHPDSVAGIVIRIPRDYPVLTAASKARELGGRLGVRPCLYIKSTSGNIAERHDDDQANARRVADATVAALTTPEVDVILDTFVDVDRGYHVRNGLVDRLYNPRPTARVLAQLMGLMSGGGWQANTGVDGIVAHLTAPDGTAWRVLEQSESSAIDLGGDDCGPWLLRD
jgi:predicted phosphodiesterase